MQENILSVERKFDIFVGAPRSGKSTKSVEIIKRYRQNVIVVKHLAAANDKAHSFLSLKTMSNWRQGAAPNEFVKCRMIARNRSELIEIIRWAMKPNGYRNGLLVIDDVSMLFRHVMPFELEELAGVRAHYGIDLLLLSHGFTKLTIDQYSYANNLFIFNCNDNPEYKKNKIPQFKRVMAAYNEAKRRYNSNNPKIMFEPVRVNITSM